MSFRPTREHALELDRASSLAPFRERFHHPPGCIYLDGNSLGLLCLDAERAVARAVEEWRERGVGGWLSASSPWFTLAEELAARTAALMGAEPAEVAVTGSTTGNLHQLLSTLWRPNSRRTKILIEEGAFPSDAYAVASHLRIRGLEPAEHLVRVPAPGGLLDEEKIVASMTDEVQIALLPSVHYVSGQLLDLALLPHEAARRGVLLGLDCSHSAGVLPHRLHEWGVDFAVWCGYKYLNGGPGGIAGLFLHRRHHGRPPGLAGWWGAAKERQFDMEAEMQPARGAAALQIGTPPVLCLAALDGALTVIEEAGMERIRRVSLALTGYLLQLGDAALSERGFRIVTPRPAERRGGHVAFAHPEALRICRALVEDGVIPDFRPPSILRLSPAPLYSRFVDCFDAVERLCRVVDERRYERFPRQRPAIP